MRSLRLALLNQKPQNKKSNFAKKDEKFCLEPVPEAKQIHLEESKI